MASFESLNDGQRAVLQLLLRQGKSYDDLAGLLKTDSAGVRARARGAVAAVGPDASEIGTERRDEIADYLLGQQTAARRAATREYLEGSPAGRSWARAAAVALGPLAGAGLPDVPGEREQGAEASEARDRGAAQEAGRSSQLGNRLLAAGIGVVLAIAIILALSLGGDGDGNAADTTPGTTTSAGTQTPRAIAQASLRPQKGGDPDANGVAAIVRFDDSNRYRFALRASGLAPTSERGPAYGVWLYTSQNLKLFLGFPDTVVGEDGALEAVSDLSPDTPNYRQILLTVERAQAPTQPGRIVLRGRLITAAAQQPQGQTQTTP